jgi:hypothetical protein
MKLFRVEYITTIYATVSKIIKAKSKQDILDGEWKDTDLYDDIKYTNLEESFGGYTDDEDEWKIEEIKEQ